MKQAIETLECTVFTSLAFYVDWETGFLTAASLLVDTSDPWAAEEGDRRGAGKQGNKSKPEFMDREVYPNLRRER
jgi:hypothetical protein